MDASHNPSIRSEKSASTLERSVQDIEARRTHAVWTRNVKGGILPGKTLPM